MSRIEYACEYKDQHNGIIYGIVYNTYEEALNGVNYYRDLIQNNDEKNTLGTGSCADADSLQRQQNATDWHRHRLCKSDDRTDDEPKKHTRLQRFGHQP